MIKSIHGKLKNLTGRMAQSLKEVEATLERALQPFLDCEDDIINESNVYIKHVIRENFPEGQFIKSFREYLRKAVKTRIELLVQRKVDAQGQVRVNTLMGRANIIVARIEAISEIYRNKQDMYNIFFQGFFGIQLDWDGLTAYIASPQTSVAEGGEVASFNNFLKDMENKPHSALRNILVNHSLSLTDYIGREIEEMETLRQSGGHIPPPRPATAVMCRNLLNYKIKGDKECTPKEAYNEMCAHFIRLCDNQASPADDHARAADSHARPADSHASPADSQASPAARHRLARAADSQASPADSHARAADSHASPADGHASPADSQVRAADSHARDGKHVQWADQAPQAQYRTVLKVGDGGEIVSEEYG